MQVIKADSSAGSMYTCERSAKKYLRSHDWLLHEEDTMINDTAMSFTVSLVCRNWGREESFYGAIMDWKQNERWKAGEVPGEAAGAGDEE